MSEVFFGKPVAEKIKQEVYNKNVSEKIVAIGFDSPEWLQYTSSMCKNAAAYNVKVESVVLNKDADLKKEIELLNADETVGGIMVQQPLPISCADAVNAVSAKKDLDCLSAVSLNKLYRNTSKICSATPQAVVETLNFYGVDLTGKNVVIVGRGYAVGRPLALLMLNKNATVTICHTKTVGLKDICKRADIIVACSGQAKLINRDYVSDKSIVIDVGLSFVDGKPFGDVDAEDIKDVVKAYSPVPGGIGPVTRACIFKNHCILNGKE